MPPTQVWMNNTVEQMALLYKGDGSGTFKLGRHRDADVPVRPASLNDHRALSRIAATISTHDLSIIRVGNSKIEIEGKNGSRVELPRDRSTPLEDVDALWFPFRPALLRWQVVWGQGAVSLQLIERPLPITHVLPMPGVDFHEWRTRWDARWCARDARGWHVDELVQAGQISPRVAALIEHVYRE